MPDPVYANSMEISSKDMGGKSICEFPDVCFTPPESPATPIGVPIPYPNTGMAGDTTDGSRSVQIGGEEVMLKDQSEFKTSTGDEAGAAAKKGLVNSKNTGAVYFIAWSMDVKIEGENVVRNLDMTTHNHACKPANGSVPTVHVAKLMKGSFSECGADAKKIKQACKDAKTTKDLCPGCLNNPTAEVKQSVASMKVASAIPAKLGKAASRSEKAATKATKQAEANKCVKALRCFLRPYAPEAKDGHKGCCPGQTPHHIPPQSSVNMATTKYDHGKALCVCLEGTNQSVGSHGKNHALIQYLADQALAKKRKKNPSASLTLGEYIKVNAAAVAVQCGCKAKCIEQQLKQSFAKEDHEKPVEDKVRTSVEVSPADQTKLNNTYAALSAGK